MKKVLVILIAALAFSTVSVAQNAIGLRFGGGASFGAEVSFQHSLGSSNRLEADLGLDFGEHYSHISIAGIYQWKWNIVNGLNWYVGPGAILGIYMSDYDDYSGFGLGIGGQIGLEYDFNSMNVPLLLSLDARPMFRIVKPDHYGGFGWGICLGLRYTF